MPSLRVMVKRRRGIKQQEETEKQQHIIVTENNLFKGFTAEGIRNYNQKQSGKLDSFVVWNSSRCARFLNDRFATSSTVTVKLAGLFSVVISNNFCIKTSNQIVFCHNNVLLLLCFFLLLFFSTSFYHNSRRRHF